MQPLCNLLAVAVSDSEPRHSSFPAKSRSAAARNGGAGAIARPARSGRHARQDRKHGGIRFVVGATFQVSSE